MLREDAKNLLLISNDYKGNILYLYTTLSLNITGIKERKYSSCTIVHIFQHPIKLTVDKKSRVWTSSETEE